MLPGSDRFVSLRHMENTAANLAPLPSGEQHSDPYRDPPVNYEAEQALLGAILSSNTALEKVAISCARSISLSRSTGASTMPAAG